MRIASYKNRMERKSGLGVAEPAIRPVDTGKLERYIARHDTIG
jgi:hypothetical protein